MNYLGSTVTTIDYRYTGIVIKDDDINKLVLLRYWNKRAGEYDEMLVRKIEVFRNTREYLKTGINLDDEAYWSNYFDIGVDLSLLSKDEAWFEEMNNVATLMNYF